MLQAPVELEAETTGIVLACDLGALDRLRDEEVQAVLIRQSQPAEWETRLAIAVESGGFRFPRLILPAARILDLPSTLESILPTETLDFETRLALIDDITSLAEELGRFTRCTKVIVRLLAEAPTATCGFHVDTVAPGLPPFGFLKVYNGETTRYVLARDVPDMGVFYDYLSKRERLSAQWRKARESGEPAPADRRQSSLLEFDGTLPFLREGARVHEVPAGAIVAFRHLDVREHWTPHRSDRTWLHCSPMSGRPRLVLNITPANGLVARPRSAAEMR